jgi:cobyric acid synthase
MDTIVTKAQETMKVCAQAFADRGHKSYTVELHCACAARSTDRSLAMLVGEDGEPAREAVLGALFHALYNQSAWRQKFEKEKIFTSAPKAKTFTSLLDELTEEGA